MNKDIGKGGSRHLRHKIKEQWLRLTEEEIDQLEGHNEKLAGKLQERYGWERGEAERQVDEFYRRHRRLH